MTSKPYSLNKTDFKTALRSALVFLAPLALIYFGQLTGTLQTAEHGISLNDFIPTQFTLGAIVLYVVNRLTDLIRKYIA